MSVDIDGASKATHHEDLLTWDYANIYPRGYFDFVWASPPCTEYSIARTTAKTPRNLELADSLVAKVLEIVAYYNCPFAMENPQTGLLKGREVVANLQWTDTSYCKYGYPYKKATRIWHDLGDFLQLRPLCCKREPCKHLLDSGKHPKTAQRGPRRGGNSDDRCSLHELHSIPPALCSDIAESVDILWCIERTNEDIEASLTYYPPEEEATPQL